MSNLEDHNHGHHNDENVEEYDDDIGISLAIAGSREFKNYALLCTKVNRIRKTCKVDCIISGGAKGADQLGEKYAKENNIKIIRYAPDWKKYGKKAGIMRNEDIVNSADYILCFWDGKSKGTQNTITRTKKTNKKLQVVLYKK